MVFVEISYGILKMILVYGWQEGTLFASTSSSWPMSLYWISCLSHVVSLYGPTNVK